MAKDIWTQLVDEIETCEKLLAILIILKGGKVAGRITARYSRTGATTFVTFQMFGWASENGEKVYGHKRMTGYGYDRTGLGIGEIFAENREKLKECYGIEIPQHDWGVPSIWIESLKKSGYDVIQAL